jgi:hypothetical protein
MNGSSSKLQEIPTLLCVVILVLTLVRLSGLLWNELRAYRDNQARRSVAPPTGSLVGIDAQGHLKKFESTRGYLVLFVIRSKHASSDIGFWDEVVHAVGPMRNGSGSSIQFWGICDMGTACNPFQREASFPIFGYLDPFEMRIVAGAHAWNEALLYNHSETLVARIPVTQDPLAVAKGLVQGTE